MNEDFLESIGFKKDKRQLHLNWLKDVGLNAKCEGCGCVIEGIENLKLSGYFDNNFVLCEACRRKKHDADGSV